MKYLGIDIGGSWIKGAIVDEQSFVHGKMVNSGVFEIKKIKSPLHANASYADLINALLEIIKLFRVNPETIESIGISTAGVINYHGTQVLKAAGHLNILKDNDWKIELENQLQCKVILINDADATSIGLAETGYLKGNKAVGILPIGTGIGFSVWRNGRRWRPGKAFTLLGSLRLKKNFDTIASASKLAQLDDSNNLINVLTNDSFADEREIYLQNLVHIINNAAILYSLDEVIICGGLSDATTACNYPLAKNLNERLKETPPELNKSVNALVAPEGNRLQLIGSILLAKSESAALKSKITYKYETLETEVPYKSDLRLEKMQTTDIIKTLWHAEQKSGEHLYNSLPLISEIVDKVVSRINSGGRIIYVGAGTSGRIAAMDAVEIPCTYGFPEDRILSVIAGGISDAAIEIESEFEEDASAVPEMLLMDIRAEDVVIGISASGVAYFVQSALAFSKGRGAFTVMIQNRIPEKALPFCDTVIPLNSGNEVVAGSTRMKAGTATKKILNFLSSTIMIKLGKVAGSFMIDVACINKKLIKRAQAILGTLYHLDEDMALDELEKADFQMNRAIQNIQAKKRDFKA